jgi:hypothetical protein
VGRTRESAATNLEKKTARIDEPHARRHASQEKPMSEDIDEGRRRFLGTAAVTIGATSAAAGAFSLLPQPPAEAVVPAARWPNT